MGNPIRLGVVFGGRSGEHEVSLVSARSVLNTLDPQKYHITQIGITIDGDWLVGEKTLATLSEKKLDQLSPALMLPVPARPEIYTISAADQGEVLKVFAELDVIFPVLHGTFGEDGTMQGLFELTDIAYVGAGVLGSSVAMDKALFKDVMIANDIPVAPSMLVYRSELDNMN
ncbi:MAG: D-alanine--D-alanine ligase A, partial [Anaerolineales bacterium]|nr:D-alanine--D-alanine ligase A [Anaerolineales bacterium]